MASSTVGIEMNVISKNVQ